jgi:hypothetical protein
MRVVVAAVLATATATAYADTPAEQFQQLHGAKPEDVSGVAGYVLPAGLEYTHFLVGAARR